MFKQVIAAAALLAAGSANATTLDVVSSFNTVGSAFSFGSGFGGGFTTSPNFAADNCVGTAGLACYNNNAGAYTFPAIGKNLTASTLTFYTNVLPTNMLFMQSLPGQTATVRFTAPVTTTYTFVGAFTRIDNQNGAGDGVNIGFYTAQQSGAAPLGTNYLDSGAINGNLVLNAGDTVDFYVDALGNTNNDGTGFAIAAGYVPEPASWALMIGGFGLVGGAMRRRSVKVRYA
jgi:hypothetical protein